MASLLTERQQGSLPSSSVVNPRKEGKEYCKAITLSSGRELEILGQPPVGREAENKEEDQVSPKGHMQGEWPRKTRSVNDNKVRKETEKLARADEPTLPISYPQHLKKGKLEKQFTKFLDIFKKLISIYPLWMHWRTCQVT